jgi:hypothetical protein
VFAQKRKPSGNRFALNLQSNKSTQLFHRFGSVLCFLGCQDGDLTGTPVQDAVMDCRA